MLSITTGAPDPRDPAWLRVGDGTSLRFHYPGTHGEVLHRWSVPLRVDGRTARIEGAVERVARPPLAWAIGAGRRGRRRRGLAMLLLPRAAARRVGRSSARSRSPRSPSPTARARRPRRGRGARSSPPSSRSPGSAVALRLRRDAALEQGALAVTAILLALPLVGRLAVLRHGVIVTTLDPDLERALVVGGLALAAGAIARGCAGLVARRQPARAAATRPVERAERERDDRDDHEQAEGRAEVVADGVGGEIVRAARVEVAQHLRVVRAGRRSHRSSSPRR